MLSLKVYVLSQLTYTIHPDLTPILNILSGFEHLCPIPEQHRRMGLSPASYSACGMASPCNALPSPTPLQKNQRPANLQGLDQDVASSRNFLCHLNSRELPSQTPTVIYFRYYNAMCYDVPAPSFTKQLMVSYNVENTVLGSERDFNRRENPDLSSLWT